MVDILYWKHRLVRTPLEGVAKQIQHAGGAWRRLKHPEMREIYRESGRTDRALHRLLTPTSNCIDIGCHIGSTLSLMMRLSPQGKHMAFEPVPQKAAWLRHKFPEVDVRQVALSDKPGTVSFSENLSRPGFSGMRAPTESSDQTRQITVACERLDDAVPAGHRVDFLKVDVEGAELMVLRGGVEILRRDRPPILFESAPDGAERFGMTREQLFTFLVTECGYSVYFLKDFLLGAEPLDFPTFDAAHKYPFKAFNYLAIARKD